MSDNADAVNCHKQLPIKVNAWVDDGILPLVVALNDFDSDLLTVDSCERDQNGAAYVAFVTRRGSLSEMTKKLSVAAGSGHEALWRVEWFDGGEEPIAQVRVAPEAIGSLADAISRSTVAERVLVARDA